MILYFKKICYLLLSSIILLHSNIARPRVAYCENPPEITHYPQICLTFDDGPTHITESILDTLKSFDVKATFFVVGKNVQKHPDILKRIFSEGHTVGIHTFSHEYKKIYSSPTALTEDINACLRAIKAVNGNYTAKYYRFPGGSFNLSNNLLAVPEKFGLTYVDWNAACRDSEITPHSPDDLTQCAITTAAGKNRIIMLLHDAADKHMTALALPDIINNFKEKSFSFTTVEKVVKIS